MNYVRYTFTCHPVKPTTEILISLLAELEFESFVENDLGLEAFVQEKLDPPERVGELVNTLEGEIGWERELIPDRNWNAQWEADYQPVEVEKTFLIRAPFHPEDSSFEYEILIQPQMSFGTGHHETTRLMLLALKELEVEGKKVADAGSGTGVLAIAAEKMGADSVFAYDVEDWAFQNTVDNIALNDSKVEVKKGDSNLMQGRNFDIILANINKNVLKEDMAVFSDSLQSEGYILLSGFFVTDISEMVEICERFGLKKVSEKRENDWAQLTLQKVRHG